MATCSHSADVETEGLRGSTMCPKGQRWRGEGTTLQSRRVCKGGEWGIDHVKGTAEGPGHTGQVHKGRGLWGPKRRVQSRAVALPEDKVRAVNLPPTAAVLQDASVAHHCTLLKLGPVVGHVLGRQGHRLQRVLSPPHPHPLPLLTAPCRAPWRKVVIPFCRREKGSKVLFSLPQTTTSKRRPKALSS